MAANDFRNMIRPGEAKTHEKCAHAYGFCFPAPDGRPILCRCHIHKDRLFLCDACDCPVGFERREGNAPVEMSVSISEDLHADERKEKVVPLFRPGQSRPWKVVKASEIGPGGISWDGTPLTSGDTQKVPETFVFDRPED